MLEGEISKITGLLLVEAVEVATIVVSIIAVSSLVLSVYYNRKQSRATSASLSVTMAELFRQPRFMTTLKYLETKQRPNENWDLDTELEVLLTHIEDIGLFVDDGVISERHVLEMYSYTLEKIKGSQDCKRIFEKYQREKPNFYFRYVQHLISKI
ncbi:MAG: hypothetical protein WD717_07070 [Nitrosarchaeum sp.]